MRILLVSTYELGHQPLGIGRPARVLEDAGHETRARDLAVDPFDDVDLDWAEAVAVSVPMHTALRLALRLVERMRRRCPQLPIALHGLYAHVAAGNELFRGDDLLAAGETDETLVAWVAGLAPGRVNGRHEPGVPRVAVEIGRPSSRSAAAPDRAQLPPLERYARLVTAGGETIAGYVEASHGCSHRCRHCPVPVVYRGRTRLVEPAAVLDDIASLVEAGAGHVTFGDPDFLNRPRHALAIVRQLDARWPGLTFDVTVKVEHILRYEDIWGELARVGCLFVVSAFESVDDRVLELLDKGHTRADAIRATSVLRKVGIEPRPSLLPFTPWTTLDGLADLVGFVTEEDLVSNIDPVQYGIRLLLPPGSLLLEHPDPQLASSLIGYDRDALTWRWRSEDPGVDELQAVVAGITETGADKGEPIEDTYERVRDAVLAAACESPAARGAAGTPRARRRVTPHLSEPWYCCAEPTAPQLESTALS